MRFATYFSFAKSIFCFGSDREDSMSLDFAVEPLERRILLAGNVDVVERGGDLVVRGDNGDNQIAIRSTATAGEFIVEPLDGETINGTSGAKTFDVSDDMRINLRNGNNQLIVTGSQGFKFGTEDFFLPDDLLVRTGSGNDIVVLDSIEVGDRVNVQTRSGDDTVVTFRIEADDAQFNLSSGDDALRVSSSEFLGSANVRTGSGDDSVLSSSSDYGRISINTGGGDDLVGIALSNTSVSDATMSGGGGDDLFFDDDTSTFGDREPRSFEGDFLGDFFDFLGQFPLRTSTFSDASLLQISEGTGC